MRYFKKRYMIQKKLMKKLIVIYCFKYDMADDIRLTFTKSRRYLMK